MTPEYLALLLDYHYWARDRVLDAVSTLSPEQYARPMDSSFSSVRDTLNHLYFAEWIWYCRWNGESPTGPPAVDFPDLPTLRAKWTEHETKVRTFFRRKSHDAFAKVIKYRRLSGEAGASPLWQLLVHLVNHSSYHRGQVVTLLRQLGAAPPPSTDMTTFFRERAA